MHSVSETKGPVGRTCAFAGFFYVSIWIHSPFLDHMLIKNPTDLHWAITHWSHNCGLVPCVWLQGWSYRSSHGWDLLGILSVCYPGSMFCLSRRALAKPHYCSSCSKYMSWMSCLTLPRQNGVSSEAKLKILKTLPPKKHKYTSLYLAQGSL